MVCGGELALLFVAALWIALAGEPSLLRFEWDMRAVLWGGLAAIPPLALFLFTLRSRLFQRHRESMDSMLRPVVAQWNVFQMAVVSLIAGACEEVLFRAVLQGWLTEHLSPAPALVLSAIVFGAAHMLTRTYAILAGTIGLYLGLEMVWTGNLLAPITTHVVYDFLALILYVRIYQPPEEPAGSSPPAGGRLF
jgi:uncharacterized protein